MSAPKRKGDAGEAAYQAHLEAGGAKVFPLSPSTPGVDLLSFDAFGHMQLTEVKAWNRPIGPAMLQKCIQTLLSVRDALPGISKGRTSLCLIHAIKLPLEGQESSPGWSFDEVWRFP